MAGRVRRLFRMLLWTAMVWTLGEVEAQNLQNPPLRKASNALRLHAPGKVPQLQPGFQNGQDVWILYSPHFDQLSGSKQTFLMRKYGLLAVPRKNDKADLHQAPEKHYEFTAPKAALALPGQDFKINNPILDILSRTQSETSSAVSGTNIVIVYNDDSLSSYGCSFSFSNDGGQTWKQSIPSLFPFGYGQGDPVVAAGPNGVIYHSQLATNTFGNDAIAVTKSMDGGATWSLPVNAALSVSGSSEAHDKEWLAVDNSNNPTRGNVYVSWSHFSFYSDTNEILFVRSLDGGKSWSKAKRIGSPSDSSSVVEGSMIAVGPGGEVYVAYYDGKLPGIVVARSADGGQSFAEPVRALAHSSMHFGKTLGGGFETSPFPSIAVDNSSGPNRGTIYIAADIKPSDPADVSDVVLVKSTDGGSKWSAPIRVNDDQIGTDQFQPSLAVAPDGTLGLMWYDRRNDPQNNVLLDVYMTTSSNGGKSFTPDRRVTSASWMLVPTPLGLRPHYHGDYNQMSSGELGFVLNWGDDRSGRDSDIYTAVLSVSEAGKQAPDFVLSADKLAVNELARGSASLSVSLAGRNGFSDIVSLESETAYPGISYQFSPTSLTAGQESVLSITVAAGTPRGTYPLSVVGSTGDLRRSVSLRLTVYDGVELSRVPLAISSAHEALLEPKAAFDTAGNLHVLFGGEPGTFGSPYGSLQYARFHGNEQLSANTVFRVSDPADGLSNYSIGVDDAGNITIIWLQANFNTGITNVFLSRSTDQGKTFSPPVNVTGLTDKKMTIYLTLLVVHKSGAINVGYVQDTPPGSPTSSTVDFWFIRSTAGGAKFSTKVNVFETNKKVGFVYSAAMALDPAGNPVFVYDASMGSTTTIFDIFLSVSKDGASFQAAVNLSKTSGSNSSAFASDPAIAIDSISNINVVYLREDFRTSERDVYFTRSVDGGAHFSEPANATHTANLGIYLFAPSVGIDRSENIGITWQALTASLIYPGGLDVFFSQSSDGGKVFSSAINISANIGQVETIPSIITSPNGQMNVLWQDETGGNDQLLVLAFGSGVSGPPQQVTPPSNLVVTPDQLGQITLNWTASPEATSYTIKRRSESESDFATIAIGVTSNSFVDKHVQVGQPYYYSVIAVNANQESPASNAASAVPVGSSVLEDKIWLLPTAARSSGLSGSFFTTDVWISNASEASLNLTLEFLRAGGQNNTAPPKATLLLAAHETRLVPNILESLFGVQSNQFGPIRFTVPGVAVDHVAIASRTFTPSADGTPGTYGLAVEARDVTSADTSVSSLVGLRQNAAFRSNLGIINLTDHVATYTLTLWSSAGATLATASGNLPAFGTSQSSLISLFPSVVNDSSNWDGLTVVVSSSDGVLMAYGTSVDNSTGDGSFISGLPVQTGLSGGSHYVPVVTKVAGAFGTQWSSRLAAFNPGSETITLFFSLHVSKSDNRGVVPVQQTLGPKATLVFSDVLEQLFHQESGYGALEVDWITSSGTVPIFSSQTATPAGGKIGTYGLQVDPVTLSHAKRSLQVTGVQQDDRFRTNIGFANPTNEVVSLSCVLRKSDGSTASTHSLTMQPLDYLQLGFNELFALSSGPKTGEVMTVEVTASVPILVYGSLIDNATQDPTYLPGQQQ